MKNNLLSFFIFCMLFFNTSYAQQNILRNGVTTPTLEINLYGRSITGDIYLADGIMQNFSNSFSPSVDNMDVRKFMNISDNLSIKNGNYNLVVERRPLISIADTLRLILTGTRIAPYRFEIDPSVLNTTITSFLIDKFLGTETSVSMNTITEITFNITSDPASKVADRFMIVYRNIIPVRFTNIVAVRNSDRSVSTTFNTENENNIDNYSIEQSRDGINFITVGTQIPTANNFGNPYYNYRDLSAFENLIWYRIKANAIIGSPIYSNIVKADKLLEITLKDYSVYPNPVTGGIVNVVLNNQQTGIYTINIVNITGQIIYTEKVQNKVPSLNKQINLSGIKAGIYRILIVGENNKKTNLSIFVN